MRLLLWLVALMATAIGIAVTARFNPGNVVFFYPPHRIDMSLNLFVVLLAVLFLTLYGVARAIVSTLRMPTRVAAYRQRKREREGNKGLRDALKALLEGRFGHAEKAAMRAAELPENAGLAALIGARAAHRMREPARREAWLAGVAHDNALKTARLMTVIELLVDDHQPEAALEAVAELNASGQRHIHALQWSMKANQQARNWPEVLRLVRILDKHKALHPALAARLREMAYEALLSEEGRDPEAIRRVWAGVPPADRTKPYIAARAAAAFNASGLPDEARVIAEEALQAGWDERIVRAYRDAAGPAGSPTLLAQIEHCEAWLREHPNDPELALTLGSLCLRQKLWGKAQRYLEQALSDATASPMVRDIHLKLAQMHEALGQEGPAASHYRQSALATML
ncbi:MULTISPECIES: heme biosynthesis protein HemY [unclassified Massilia]|uniref:heme biosynthesis protein HemY n=1 Tax=unclassified Massilia TaxID=2609279 RepID=UPI00177B4008|nr:MULTISPECIES: heme biosynthesis protein HemY [unclassified Massilia]MBD8532163.1 heme biosynthesis protein HemY [Massilia sp. CFBP 13647]MBD8675579.1 heme biosynthesis protein HemY [Massilia sp. CFBP 13721]